MLLAHGYSEEFALKEGLNDVFSNHFGISGLMFKVASFCKCLGEYCDVVLPKASEIFEGQKNFLHFSINMDMST